MDLYCHAQIKAIENGQPIVGYHFWQSVPGKASTQHQSARLTSSAIRTAWGGLAIAGYETMEKLKKLAAKISEAGSTVL